MNIADETGTGNIYQVKISKEPNCSCPDALNGNQCKHIVYVCSLDQLVGCCADLNRYSSIFSKHLKA
jgi:hypothetical protein